MVLTNLDLTQEPAFAAVRKDTVPPMMPVKEKKAIVIRTRRNGLSERRAKDAKAKAKSKAKAKAKAKANEREKEKLKETGTGKEMARNYLAPTTTNGMATANGATTVVSPTMVQREESVSTRREETKKRDNEHVGQGA